MRTFILIALAALLSFVSAIPITPSAPRLQKRAEQFRLQGLREFEIAEKLSSTLSESSTFRSRISNKFHAVFHHDSALDAHNLFAGDIAPGSLDAPSMLPKALAAERDSFFRSICALFHAGDGEDLGYEGKEGEMRRPSGSRHWKQSFGGFRR